MTTPREAARPLRPYGGARAGSFATVQLHHPVGHDRALAAEPDLIICDEITSALDASVQAAIAALIECIRQEGRTAFLFICHDLALVRALADRVLVLDNGQVVDFGPVAAVFNQTGSNYIRDLIDTARTYEWKNDD